MSILESTSETYGFELLRQQKVVWGRLMWGRDNRTSLEPLQFIHDSVSANILRKDFLDELQTVIGSVGWLGESRK